MPKVKINYAEMIFYKICCSSTNITKVFIGHTTNVNQRKHILKKQTQSETYCSDMIEFIKNSGGWENWSLQILEKYECKTHIDIVLREIYHTDALNHKMNNPDNSNAANGLNNGNNTSFKPGDNNTSDNLDKIFTCNYCNYRCLKSKHFKQHLMTRKHMDEVQNQVASSATTLNELDSVGGEDKKQLGFIVNECYDESSENKNDLIIQLLKDNESMKIFMKEQNDMLKEMIANHNTTTTNNIRHKNIKQKFNINIFLNEQCKDAINMCDFIKSLKVTFHDLEITRDKSLEESVSTIMLRGLKELDVYKRPIHCTDQKRDVMYIKDEEKWEKDDGNVKLKESIDTLSKKQMYTLKELRDSDPEIKTNDDKRDKFIVTMNHVTTPITEMGGKKMIKTIGKEIFIDKESDGA
uniref:C2H2-type domain-containing protein n=1 Tax=viral metagenome TaxID=1070528 RepID=A0A6C0EZV9_9ZZZZ